MENIINAILGLQKQREEKKHHKQSDGNNEVKHSLICFHDFSDWFKF
ncbi:hypothetical protein [Lactobacillus intestinalis]|nr:hypothetical protein [Lactobacillus intestinalis]UTW40070.1 hypothetical protein KBW87_06710 [Lactobacillus intestinalis]